jgi:hypothetical protein
LFTRENKRTPDTMKLGAQAAKPSTDDFATNPSMNDAKLDPLVRELNAVCKAMTLQFELAVGELVVKNLYSWDVSRLRCRGRKRDATLRKVASHPDLGMSRSMLYHCIGVYELCERLQLRSWRHVSTSHLRLVLPLASDSHEKIPREAEANRWSVSRLEEEVVGLGPISRNEVTVDACRHSGKGSAPC